MYEFLHFFFAVSNNLTWWVLKAQLNVLSEPTAVVIHDCLGVPEHLQQRVHLCKTRALVFIRNAKEKNETTDFFFSGLGKHSYAQQYMLCTESNIY